MKRIAGLVLSVCMAVGAMCVVPTGDGSEKVFAQEENVYSSVSKVYSVDFWEDCDGGEMEAFEIIGCNSYAEFEYTGWEYVDGISIFADGKCTLKAVSDKVDIGVYRVNPRLNIERFELEHWDEENYERIVNPDMRVSVYDYNVPSSVELNEGVYILEMNGLGICYTRLVVGDEKELKAGAPAVKTSDEMFGGVSDWGKREVEEALYKNIIPDGLVSSMLTENITRSEFSSVAVALYEAVTGTNADLGELSDIPFEDVTENHLEVRKAYTLGIINGVSETKFDLDSLISREQMATMLCRVYKKIMFEGWNMENDSEYPLSYGDDYLFNDHADISDYAIESIYFMYDNLVIYGAGPNVFMPKPKDGDGFATREEAIIMALRCYNNLFGDGMDFTEKEMPGSYCDSLTITCEEDIKKALEYDSAGYLEVYCTTISDFSFLKDIYARELCVVDLEHANDFNAVLPEETKTFDLGYVNPEYLSKLTVVNVDLKNTDCVKTFDKLKEFCLRYDYPRADVKDLGFLRDCTGLKELYLYSCGIENLDFISEMKSLSILKVEGAPLADIGAVAKCEELLSVTLDSCMISDVSPLNNLKKISSLSLKDNYITDVSPIKDISANLQYLNLDENFISDISMLERALNGAEYFLRYNYIETIPENFAGGWNCGWINMDLSYNNIKSISEKTKRALDAERLMLNLFDNPLNEETVREIYKKRVSFIPREQYECLGIEEVIEYNKKMADAVESVNKGDEKEKVFRTCKYIYDNVRMEFGEEEDMHNGYGAMMKKAVCDGFTEATNSMLRRLGIATKSYFGDMVDLKDGISHAWTIVYIDGKAYNCDVLQSQGHPSENGLPCITMLSDDELKDYGHIFYALNIKCPEGISAEERQSIIEKVNQ